MSNSSPPKYRFRFLQFFLLFLIAECPYIDLLVWVLHFLISPRLYLKWIWNSGIYENFTLTNTNAIFFFRCFLFVQNYTELNSILRARAKVGAGRGAGGRASPLFEKKNKLRNTHFLGKGIFDWIRILDWRTSPEHTNLWLVRFDPVSLWQASKWLSLQNYT